MEVDDLSALRRSVDRTAGFYYPLLFAVGTDISPFEFLQSLEKLEQDSQSVSDEELQRLLTYYHEFVHALTFLNTRYSSIVLGGIDESMKCVQLAGGPVKSLISKDIRKIVGGYIVGEEVEKRYSEGGVYGRDDIVLNKTRNYKLSQALAGRISKECLEYKETLLGAFNSYEKEVDTNLTLISFEVDKSSNLQAGLCRISCEMMISMGLSFSGIEIYGSYGIPCYNFKEKDCDRLFILNATILAESISILAELNFLEHYQIKNISDTTFNDFINSLSPEYRICFECCGFSRGASSTELKLTIIALAEICFLFGSLNTYGSSEDNLIIGDMFFKMCEVLEELELPQSEIELYTFISKLAEAVAWDDFPAAREHALKTGIVFLYEYYDLRGLNEPMMTRSGDSLFVQATNMYFALKEQLNDDKLAIPQIINPDLIKEHMVRSQFAVHYFDIETKHKWPYCSFEWDGENFVASTTTSFINVSNKMSWGASLLPYAVLNLGKGRDMGCPLKQGVPYKCSKNTLKPDFYCGLNESAIELSDASKSDSIDYFCPYAIIKRSMDEIFEENLSYFIAEWDDWNPGLIPKSHTNIIASEKPGEWHPAPGYTWINEEIFLVQWQEGKVYPGKEWIISTQRERCWRVVGGVGLSIEYSPGDNYPAVMEVFRESPSSNSIISAGMFIQEIDGNTTKNKSLSFLLNSLAGEVGTSVKLVVRKRNGIIKRKVNVIRGCYELTHEQLSTKYLFR